MCNYFVVDYACDWGLTVPLDTILATVFLSLFGIPVLPGNREPNAMYKK